MALEVKSLDEITTEAVDAYDARLQEATGKPLRVWRNHNNKLFLIFRGIAAGLQLLLDAIITLRNRFNPAVCDEVDLYSTAKLVGTEAKQGTGSLLTITMKNRDPEEPQVLAAGTYRYIAVSGMEFRFDLANDLSFLPEELRTISAISLEKGAYRVYQNSDIRLIRTDGAAINGSIVFSCADNLHTLGYGDEDTLDFRKRILTDAERQDHIKELELAVRNLPNIFECNLIFNHTEEAAEVDGMELDPYQMLVILTGNPTHELADQFVRGTVYHTKKIEDEDIPGGTVYHEDEHYIGGRYPVHYVYHRKVDFRLEIEYQYDHNKLKNTQIEAQFNAALDIYRNVVRHVDVLTEENVYTTLQQVALPDVKVLSVRIFQGPDNTPYLRVPFTRMYNLTEVAFSGEDIAA
jgi:hypothetical protein